MRVGKLTSARPAVSDEIISHVVIVWSSNRVTKAINIAISLTIQAADSIFSPRLVSLINH